MRHVTIQTILGVCCILSLAIGAAPAAAQKESVKPGINKSFEEPNVKFFTGIFEREGRDAFDHQDEILQECKIEPGMTVADVGAGTGLFTHLFAESVGPQGKVYAVDISDEFVDHIEKAAKHNATTNITGIVCDPFDAKLPPASCDLIFICDTYHHFEFPQRTMRSIRRALKPGGRVVLVDFHRIKGKSSAFIMGHVRAGQEVFVGEITDSGFRQTDEKPDMLDESYFLVFAKAEPAAAASSPQ